LQKAKIPNNGGTFCHFSSKKISFFPCLFGTKSVQYCVGLAEEIATIVVLLIVVLPAIVIALIIAINHRKQRYCPNCGRHTLKLLEKEKLHTGQYKRKVFWLYVFWEREREVSKIKKFFKCSNCGHQLVKEEYND